MFVKVKILALLGILLCTPIFIGYIGGDYWVRILDFALLYVMLALGLNIVVGFAGLLDLGYIAFYALGAYLTALLSSPHLSANFSTIAQVFPDGLHLSTLIILPLSAILVAVFGVLLGGPTLRLRGDYLAIVTLGFGEIIRVFINNLDRPANITNGPKGINNIDPVVIFGVDFSTTLDLWGFAVRPVYLSYYLFFAITCLMIVLSTRLQYCRIGRAWIAIREDELAAKAMGINTANMKLLAFAIGAVFGGMAGVMFASFQGFVSPESFNVWESITVLAMIVLGGIGHIPGVILGAVLLSILPEFLHATIEPMQIFLFKKILLEVEVVRQLLYGITMIGMMLYRPLGLWPTKRYE